MPIFGSRPSGRVDRGASLPPEWMIPRWSRCVRGVRAVAGVRLRQMSYLALTVSSLSVAPWRSCRVPARSAATRISAGVERVVHRARPARTTLPGERLAPACTGSAAVVQCITQKVAAGAGLQRVQRLRVAGIHDEHDDARVQIASDRADGVEPAHLGICRMPMSVASRTVRAELLMRWRPFARCHDGHLRLAASGPAMPCRTMR